MCFKFSTNHQNSPSLHRKFLCNAVLSYDFGAYIYHILAFFLYAFVLSLFFRICVSSSIVEYKDTKYFNSFTYFLKNLPSDTE